MARANCPRCGSRATASQLRDKDGFVGDQASQTAFRELLERWRRRHRKKGGKDPLGAKHSRDLSQEHARRGAEAEARPPRRPTWSTAPSRNSREELAWVIERFLRQPSWKGVERIVIGGGFPESDVGERAVLQAAAILQHMDIDGRSWARMSPRGRRRRPDRLGAPGAAADAEGPRRDPGARHRRHQRALRHRQDAHAAGARPVEGQGAAAREVAPCGRRPEPQACWSNGWSDMLEEQIRYCRQEGHPARALHRHRLPGPDPQGRLDRARRAEPAGRLGERHFHLPTELCKRMPHDRRRADAWC